jgi:predicted ester cyclase
LEDLPPSAPRLPTPVAEPLESFYRRYNDVCNAHEFSRLAEFVADDVQVNGERQGLDGYIAGLQAVVTGFPDYRWDLRHLLIDGCWLAAHFIDTGTHQGTFLGIEGTGATVTTQEFALYRVHEQRIHEVWVTADDLSLREQLQSARDLE